MDAVNDLDNIAFVLRDEVSYFWRTETSKASSCLEGLPVALSERLYHVPLIEFSGNIGPHLNLVRSIGVQGPHGLVLLETANVTAI
jgi:hypothetical protein